MPVQTRSQKAKTMETVSISPAPVLSNIPKLEDITSITFNGRVFNTEPLLNKKIKSFCDSEEANDLFEALKDIQIRFTKIHNSLDEILEKKYGKKKVPITDKNYKMGNYFINDELSTEDDLKLCSISHELYHLLRKKSKMIGPFYDPKKHKLPCEYQDPRNYFAFRPGFQVIEMRDHNNDKKWRVEYNIGKC